MISFVRLIPSATFSETVGRYSPLSSFSTVEKAKFRCVILLKSIFLTVSSAVSAGEVIEAIKARKNYENEDWLIILTSDHGGFVTSHGGLTIQERMTFIVINKEIEL